MTPQSPKPQSSAQDKAPLSPDSIHVRQWKACYVASRLLGEAESDKRTAAFFMRAQSGRTRTVHFTFNGIGQGFCGMKNSRTFMTCFFLSMLWVTAGRHEERGEWTLCPECKRVAGVDL